MKNRKQNQNRKYSKYIFFSKSFFFFFFKIEKIKIFSKNKYNLKNWRHNLKIWIFWNLEIFSRVSRFFEIFYDFQDFSRFQDFLWFLMFFKIFCRFQYFQYFSRFSIFSRFFDFQTFISSCTGGTRHNTHFFLGLHIYKINLKASNIPDTIYVNTRNILNNRIQKLSIMHHCFTS